MRTCAIIHLLHLELETAHYKLQGIRPKLESSSVRRTPPRNLYFRVVHSLAQPLTDRSHILEWSKNKGPASCEAGPAQTVPQNSHDVHGSFTTLSPRAVFPIASSEVIPL